MTECDFIGQDNKPQIPLSASFDTYAMMIHAMNVQKGFYDDEAKVMRILEEAGDDEAMEATVKAFMMQRVSLIHSELSEGVEAARKNEMDTHLPQYDGLSVELADALIRILDMAGAYSIPIGEIVTAKLIYNADRPHKHGKCC